jgi:hypothetical protein
VSVTGPICDGCGYPLGQHNTEDLVCCETVLRELPDADPCDERHEYEPGCVCPVGNL